METAEKWRETDRTGDLAGRMEASLSRSELIRDGPAEMSAAPLGGQGDDSSASAEVQRLSARMQSLLAEPDSFERALLAQSGRSSSGQSGPAKSTLSGGSQSGSSRGMFSGSIAQISGGSSQFRSATEELFNDDSFDAYIEQQQQEAGTGRWGSAIAKSGTQTPLATSPGEYFLAQSHMYRLPGSDAKMQDRRAAHGESMASGTLIANPFEAYLSSQKGSVASPPDEKRSRQGSRGVSSANGTPVGPAPYQSALLLNRSAQSGGAGISVPAAASREGKGKRASEKTLKEREASTTVLRAAGTRVKCAHCFVTGVVIPPGGAEQLMAVVQQHLSAWAAGASAKGSGRAVRFHHVSCGKTAKVSVVLDAAARDPRGWPAAFASDVAKVCGKGIADAKFTMVLPKQA